ncbi:hypothetical protein S40285_09352 [Stachybotrys chlorohalonatus IBT 40285]|uniref:Uncharacterized protein n=1 Tax=Stachybotrys chlorohalonatus (strain IBT 40285) TaxID=1283841 RepID=A0A084R2V9_STAC4|nr:hypothetical protein S40285_09352 [Stachybotrys chlorohalonata IBT 40285]
MGDMDPATRALMNCISYAAVATLAEEEIRLNFGADQRVLMTRFRKGPEYALAAAEFVTTADLTAVQAFTIYGPDACVKTEYDDVDGSRGNEANFRLSSHPMPGFIPTPYIGPHRQPPPSSSPHHSQPQMDMDMYSCYLSTLRIGT